MGEQQSLVVEPRDRAGRGAARAVRRQGRVPGVIYGGKEPPAMVTMDIRDIRIAYEKGGFMSRLVELDIKGKKQKVLPRDVQLDPVSDRPVHVDFLRVLPDTRIKLSVPMQFVGNEESPGIKRGGVLNVVRHQVEVYCRADSIPDHLTANLVDLDIGDSVHISMVALPEGVRPTITTRDFTVATIAPPTVYVEEVPVAAAAAVPVEGEAPAEGVPGTEGAAGAPGAAPAAPGAKGAAAGAKGAAAGAKGAAAGGKGAAAGGKEEAPAGKGKK
ncbi:MAG: 50S ribosomal protein L25/general stress protein Ctc [Alphaproteobacteria bacterium]|nr:50S ribosomal protein L25/general stress protein Ctc [Alphaproteobacteria bacterium]